MRKTVDVLLETGTALPVTGFTPVFCGIRVAHLFSFLCCAANVSGMSIRFPLTFIGTLAEYE